MGKRSRQETPSLFEKMYGCHAAVTVSNSMGDLTEGMSYQEIERRFGFGDRLLPQETRGSVRPRPVEDRCQRGGCGVLSVR